MAVTRHPNGYLQIDRFEDIQVIAPPGQSQQYPNGSILWRLFRSWNERRHSIGMSIFEYRNDQFLEVQEIEQATIYQGANLQNYKFWRRLQELAYEKISNTETDSDYVNSIIYGDPEQAIGRTKDGSFHPLPNGIINGSYNNMFVGDVFSDTFGNEIIKPATSLDDSIFFRHVGSNNLYTTKFAAYESLGQLYRRFVADNSNPEYGYIQPRDIIGTHIINDILMVYSRVLNVRPWFYVNSFFKEWSSLIYGNYGESIESICQRAYAGENPSFSTTPSPEYYSGFLINLGQIQHEKSYFENGASNYVQWIYYYDHQSASRSFSRINKFSPQRANAIFATTSQVLSGNTLNHINTLGTEKNYTISFPLSFTTEYEPLIPSATSLNYESYFPNKDTEENPPRKYTGKNCDNIEGDVSVDPNLGGDRYFISVSVYYDYMFLQIICRFSDLPKQGDPL